jgi:hypothetical protein
MCLVLPIGVGQPMVHGAMYASPIGVQGNSRSNPEALRHRVQKISRGVKWLHERCEVCKLHEEPMSSGAVTKMVGRCRHPVTVAGQECRASRCDRATSRLRPERAALGPLHLLLAAEPLAHHRIQSRFHKAGADTLAVTIPLSIIGNEGAIPAARWSAAVRS